MSARLKLALSYAGLVTVTGLLLVAVVWVFLLRYVPDQAVNLPLRPAPGSRGESPNLFIPGRGDLWRAFAPKAALALGFLLVVGCAGGWFLAGRMLAPLRRITEAARLVGGGDLSHRVRLDVRTDEFGELADAFDGMVARVEAQVHQQERFAANASHELRTPLAITRTLLEVAANDPDHDVPDLLARLQAVNTRAIDLTEALLLMSRAEQRSFRVEPVDLSLIVEEATESLLPLAEKHGLALKVEAEAAPTTGSPALLAQLVANLVHNAIVHNRPEVGVVWVSTQCRSGAATLVVENTGERLDPETILTLAEPFRRGTERVHSDQAGAGLGLAIVKSLCEAHGGTLSLTARPDGGLSAKVELDARTTLPLPPASRA